MLQTWRVKLFCQGVPGPLCQLSHSVLWLIVILLKTEVDAIQVIDEDILGTYSKVHILGNSLYYSH